MEKFLIGVLVIILIALGAYYFLVLNNEESVVPETVEVKTGAAAVTVRTKVVENYTQEKKSVSLNIPQIETKDVSFNSFANNAINEELDADTVYDSFTAGMDESDIGLFTYEANYERNNCYDFLSLVVTQRIQLASDRVITRRRAFNFDTKLNRVANLQDLFSNKGMYKKRIIENVLSQAKERGIQLIDDGVFLTINDSQSFFIENNKLFILYEAGEIAAVSFGELAFEMPFGIENGLFVY